MTKKEDFNKGIKMASKLILIASGIELLSLIIYIVIEINGYDFYALDVIIGSIIILTYLICALLLKLRPRLIVLIPIGLFLTIHVANFFAQPESITNDFLFKSLIFLLLSAAVVYVYKYCKFEQKRSPYLKK